jgi:hypothetical protein
MPTNLPNAFIEIYNAEVLRIYQDTGFRLPSFCKPGAVQAERIYWHTMEPVDEDTDIIENKRDFDPFTFKGQAHGKIDMETVDLEQPHAMRSLDLIRTNVDFRSNYVQNQMAAMGRKADRMVRDAALAGANSAVLGPGAGTALLVEHFHQLRETFDRAHIPADGRRYLFVSPGTWSNLLLIPEFVRQDFLGGDVLPYSGAGIQAKEFQTFKVIQDPSVVMDGNVARNIAWYHECMGWGNTSSPATEISWHNERTAWLIVTRMQVGAKALDDTGIYEFAVDETAGVDSRYYRAEV